MKAACLIIELIGYGFLIAVDWRIALGLFLIRMSDVLQDSNGGI